MRAVIVLPYNSLGFAPKIFWQLGLTYIILPGIFLDILANTVTLSLENIFKSVISPLSNVLATAFLLIICLDYLIILKP